MMNVWKWAAPSAAVGASLLAWSYVGAAAPVAAAIDGGDQVDAVVECGEEFSVRPVIQPWHFELKRYLEAPEGSNDDEVAALLADQNALLGLLAQALLAEAQASGQLYDWSCAYCEEPGACQMWLTGWSPAPLYEIRWFIDGRYLIVEAELHEPVTLTVSCTGC